MRIDILSLFPQIATHALSESIIGRAQQRALVEIYSHNIRDWARDKHRTTDDTPYGGGQGMVMKCEPVFAALSALRSEGCKVVFMSPAGAPFRQATAQRLAGECKHIIILCGHYEGVDQRVIDLLVDEEVSIGDYVLTNGVIAAVVVVDAIVRLLPEVLGDAASALEDSFATGLLEFPQYTRPVEFEGMRVPDILLGGNHAAIAKWRQAQALAKTRRLRPDLLP
jgi:tRNA (guanine37-N1)-methyltransferase